MSKHTLDVKGQLCPIPVIRTQNQAKNLRLAIHWRYCARTPGRPMTFPPGAASMATPWSAVNPGIKTISLSSP